MAYGYMQQINSNYVKGLPYWINQFALGNIKIHADRTLGARYSRTSQEAYDNMLTLYTILSDDNTGCYDARLIDGVAYVDDLVCGTPGTIRDFIIKSKIRPSQSGGSGLTDGCGSDVTHGTTTICGQGGVDINKLKAKTCLMTSIAGLMGIIEVVSGYNPFFYTQDYIDMQGYLSAGGDHYYSMDGTTTYTYSQTDRYNVTNYSLNNIVWTPYDYCNYWTNGVSNYNMGSEAQMRNCKYGILGLFIPYSCHCYSYGRKYNPQNNPSIVRLTDGDLINYIEQILYDICGLVINDTAWMTVASQFTEALPWGLSNGNVRNPKINYTKFNGQSGHLTYYNERIFNNNFTYDFNHWNGQYTKRELSNIVCDYGELEAYNNRTGNYDSYVPTDNHMGGFIAPITTDPPWSNRLISLSDYQYLPWWASGIRNQPEAAAVQLINSIDTWGAGYWTAEKIQQAREAARYWYDRFGGPGDDEGIKFAGKTNYNYVIMNI